MSANLKDAFIYFANGLYLQAKSFGAEGTFIGEAVFNTSMSGYQEIITDPSYAGQFVIFTMPEIGIVGTNDKDMESRSCACVGMLCASYNDFASNFRSQENLADFLKARGIMGICNVPTRHLVKMLTTQGAMMMIVSTHISQETALKAALENEPHISDINLIPQVSTKAPYTHTDSIFDFAHCDYAIAPRPCAKIIAMDFGIKRNILNELCNVGLEVEVVPHSTSADSILARYHSGEIAGVFLSNGPGDPLMLQNEIAQIQKLIADSVPIFGICLGHQLLAIAHGYQTYKLKFGHHGGNHPIKNLQNGAVEITAQNHNYCVPESIAEIATITHRNLFDGTIEGLTYKNKPIFSIQHHPESSPGPKEARTLFKSFASLCIHHASQAK